ncbi:uroplakin-3b [Pseudorasbora parva]|uniref:uroplakin-3b n=1 Tax=Pseudorasbora parva TaxID=51549 RepID=UPI00351E67A3
MNTNAVIRLMSLLSMWTWTGRGRLSSLQPQLTTNNFIGKITSNTVILKQPYCISDQTKDGDELWLVAALCSANTVFDNEVTNAPTPSAPYILNLSPYPKAFDPPSWNFFVTRVGPLANFPCNQASNDVYFKVGTDGKCSGTNCNGILPDGSPISFKYLQIDVSRIIVNSSSWSACIPLAKSQNLQTIDDGLSARSGAMVVIISILCAAVALLLLIFFIMLCVAYCGRKKDISQGTSPSRGMNSIRIPRYDIHSLRRAHPYDNPSYESEWKNYFTSDTLPKSGIQTQKS